MTMARKIFGLPVCCVALSGNVFAADVGTTVRAAPIHGVTAEVKPLTTLLSAIPGVGAVSLGVEMETRDGLAPFIEATALNSNLPKRLEDKGKEKGNLYPNKLKGGQVDLGARFYTQPKYDSWYVGAKVGYAEAGGEWKYHDSTVDHRMATWTPGLGAGYRWRWDNQMVVRLGAGVSANVVQKQEISRERGDKTRTAEAGRKVKDRFNQAVLANVDLGVGYMF